MLSAPKELAIRGQWFSTGAISLRCSEDTVKKYLVWMDAPRCCGHLCSWSPEEGGGGWSWLPPLVKEGGWARGRGQGGPGHRWGA